VQLQRSGALDQTERNLAATLPSRLPALQAEATSVSSQFSSNAGRVAELANRATTVFTNQETQARQISQDIFVQTGRTAQSSSLSGTAFHDVMGAAARGIDLRKFDGALQIELKTHWGQALTESMLSKATQQSLNYSQQYQLLEALVPIRIVRHYFLNPALGESVKMTTY
jgi:hypothetical protein